LGRDEEARAGIEEHVLHEPRVGIEQALEGRARQLEGLA
jgi:hypothetical protein